MRLLKLALAGACALGVIGLSPARSAEPVKIRMSWVAPLANWASIVLEKKDLAKHMGADLGKGAGAHGGSSGTRHP